MRRQLTVAVSGLILSALLSACSGANTGAAVSTTAVTASVTQSAPSVWSPPESVGSTTQAATSGSASATDLLASGVTALPGLSETCTAVLHAQAAVNALFAAGLASTAATPPAAGSTPGATDPESAGTAATTTAPTLSPPGTTASAPAPGTVSAAPPATTKEVESLFATIADVVPAPLASAFDTLKAASLGIVGKSPDDVSDILAQQKVVNAMRQVSDFVAACKPQTTQ